VGAVASVISAISGIISNFQFHAMNKSLDLIVNHTLRMFNVLDQWYLAAQDWFGQEFTRLGEIWRDMRLGFDAVVLALTGNKLALLGPLPNIPDTPGAPQVSSQSGKVYNSSTKSAMSLGGVTITVNESTNARETAREIAGALKTMSSRFGTYGT
jgi:hypothetical protein